LFWDVDKELVQELKKHSVLVLHQVGTRADAQRALRAGVDVLIAQGVEAGGHVRGNVSTLALVPELAAMSSVPVVASGGIATGAGLVAALALGAQGVSCGSLFLATRESNAHPLHQQRLCDAHAEDTLHTFRFYRNWPMAAPVRVLPNATTQGDYDHLRNLQEPTIIAEQDGQAVMLFSTDSPLRDATGKFSSMALYAGQSCSQIDAVRPVAECVQKLVSEACHTLSSLQSGCEEHAASNVNSTGSEPGADLISHEELVPALRELLAAERAGARTAAACLTDAHTDALQSQLRQLHRQEVSSCRALLRCLEHLGVEPGQAVGDFYQKVMVLDTLQDRMALIDKGQRWVLRRVENLLLRLDDTVLRQHLETVRRYHDPD
jgi:nitronate monooxygenase